MQQGAALAVNKLFDCFSPILSPWIEAQKNIVFERALRETSHSVANNLCVPLHQGYECLRLGIKKTKIETKGLRTDIGGNLEKTTYNISLFNIQSFDFDKNNSNYAFALSAAAKELNCAINTGKQGLNSGFLRGGADLIWRVTEKDYAKFNTIEDEVGDKIFLKNLSRYYVKMIEVEIPATLLSRENKILSLEKIMCFLGKLNRVANGKPIGVLLNSPDQNQLKDLFERIWLRDLKIDFITIEQEFCSGYENEKAVSVIEETFLIALNAARDTVRNFGLPTKIIASGKFVSEFEILRALAMGADSCITHTPFDWLLTGRLNAPISSGISVKSLIENFHRNTLKATARLMGECGFEGTEDISAERFLKKVGKNSIKTLRNVYQVKLVK